LVGQVFRRASPILTWRPALAARAERERLENGDAQELSGASLIEDRESIRFSRAPTRKMVAWPIVPRLRRETPRADARRRLVRAVGAAVVTVLLILAAAVAVGAWAVRSIRRPEPPPARVLAAHVLDERVDTLAPAVAAIAAPPAKTVAPQPVSQAARPAARPNQRGRTRHAHRPTACAPTASVTTPSARR
jgi:Na+-transporting methylmalonyl-CoA/oxaloacetate decarboxylase gamma subunit